MVTAAVMAPAGQGRWLKYATFSMLANALIVSAAGLPRLPESTDPQPVMKISLAALAAPKPATPAVPPPPTDAPVRAPVAGPDVVTDAAAEHSVAPALEEPAATPVAALPTQPVESVRELPPAPRRPALPPEPVAVAKIPPQVDTPKPTLPDLSPDAPPEEPVIETAALGDAGRDGATVVQEARYRRQVPPVYPPRALDLGQEGTVVLDAEIASTGMPVTLEVAESSGYSLLDNAAVAAVRHWEFEPFAEGGLPVAGRVRVPVHFVIQR